MILLVVDDQSSKYYGMNLCSNDSMDGLAPADNDNKTQLFNTSFTIINHDKSFIPMQK